MSPDVYDQLRQRLDQFSVGFPATVSGVELEILRRLFAEDEAVMFLALTPRPVAAAAVAANLERDPEQVAELLERMAHKGLVFRFARQGEVYYSSLPFVVGIYEYQVNNMDQGLAELMERYFDERFAQAIAQQTAPLRPIAVNRAVDTKTQVATYDNSRAMIQSQEKIAVARCICRMEKGLLGKGCDKPSEVCLAFGPHAAYCVDIGMSRWISREEALAIMDQCEEAGLVPMPTNSQNPVGLCNCCGDCCGVLTSIKKHPRPAEAVLSNYYAEVDPELCMGCGLCLERCQMEALELGPDDVVQVDLDRCIGCGLCITTCPEEALELRGKAPAARTEPPVKFSDAVIAIQKSRGL